MRQRDRDRNGQRRKEAGLPPDAASRRVHTTSLPARVEGIIVTYRPDQGMGYILDAQEVEWWFHATGCQEGTDFEALRGGDRVRFTPTFAYIKGEKKRRAVAVELIPVDGGGNR